MSYRLILLTVATTLAGCGDDTGPSGSISLSITPTSAPIPQGGSAAVTATLTRSGGFTGAVIITVQGAPTGVTGTVSNVVTTGNATTATVTIAVAAAVPLGVYNLTVRGQGTGITDATAAFTLTVTAAAADFSLSLSAPALTIEQGGSAPTTVTITRTNFADAVTLSLGGAPAAVTGVFDPAAPTGTSSVLTVTVGAAVVPGVYNLTVDGTGTPGTRSTPLTLTVAAAANFSLSLSAPALTIAQGGNAQTTVTITRTPNFPDAVTMSLGGAPAGVTGAFVPPAPAGATGTSSVLTVTVGAAVAPGLYNLTVDGSTDHHGTRSAALTLIVTAPGGGNVTVSFAACAAADKPVWLAFQDGTGPWTRVTGAADIYSFSITSGKGGVAWATTGGGGSAVHVQYMTQAELTAGTVTFCTLVGGNTVTGTAAGVGATQTAQISLGGATTVATSGALAFTLNGVKNGTHDLMAFRNDIPFGANNRGLLRRDLNIANNGSVGTVDMAGAESFAAAEATMTLAGLGFGETVMHGMFYHVGATCELAVLYAGAGAAASFTAFGIPAASQRASDFHGIFVSATTGFQFRTITEYFHTLAARTLTLGALMPVPTITSLVGSYKRLQAVYTLPADYQSSTVFRYTDAGGTKSVTLVATFGYLGGAAVTLALPDFSALAGWDNSWPPASASTGTWSATGYGSNLTGSVCTENARVRTGTLTGIF